MSKNDMVTVLRQLNLRTVLTPHKTSYVARLNWAARLFDNIYEVGITYDEGGGHTWYAEIVDGQFKFISCAQYLTLETIAIRLKLEEEGLSLSSQDEAP